MKMSRLNCCFSSKKAFSSRLASRSLLGLLLLIAPVLVVPSAEALEETCKICVVDMRRLAGEAIPGKKIKQKLKEEVGKAEGGIAALKAKFTTLQKEIGEQSSLLSSSALQKKQKELENTQRDLADEVRDAQERLSLKEREAMKEFFKLVDVALTKWSKSHPDAVVLEKDPTFVVYASKTLDVTDSIKKLVDQGAK
jgi:Skp family chaperone for outer membrane proteins